MLYDHGSRCGRATIRLASSSPGRSARIVNAAQVPSGIKVLAIDGKLPRQPSVAVAAELLKDRLPDVLVSPKFWPQATLVKCPMADGGEGTVESILAACEGELRRTRVRGPLGAAVEAAWGWLPHNHTAIIEMAEASGLQLVPPGQRDACISSTFGTGELIRAIDPERQIEQARAELVGRGAEVGDVRVGKYVEMRLKDLSRAAATERVRGDIIEVYPSYEEFALRIGLFGDELGGSTEARTNVGGVRLSHRRQFAVLGGGPSRSRTSARS